MSPHEYQPQQALQLILDKIRARDENLASAVQSAINAGKDVSEIQELDRKRKSRTYRKAVPFSIEEALQIAVKVLQAYFVEMPLFIISSAGDFKSAAIGESIRGGYYSYSSKVEEQVKTSAQGVPKELEVELQTETQLTESNEGTLSLKPPAVQLVAQQHLNIKKLSELLSFDETENDGNFSRT